MRSSRLRIGPAFALALLFAAAAASAAEPFSRGLLFRVDRPGARISWVFGTIHSADPRALALPPPVARAFAQARAFAGEILVTEVDTDDFTELAQFDDGRSLRDFLDAGTVAEIGRALGVAAPDDAALVRLKPWAVMLKLAQPRSPPAGAGVTLDASLLSAARARRMALVGLELPAEQASAFDAIPIESQVALVRHLLRERSALDGDHAKTMRAWLDRDLGELMALARAPGREQPALAPHFARLARELVENRSAVMAHRLFMPLRRGGVFVAVGALHLPGERGLLALLRDQGYRVRRVY
jgi:uncharacterized protein YbaP (TraB family)